MTNARVGEPHFKDAILDRVAKQANVAQFVSFAPGSEPRSRYSRVLGHPANDVFVSPEAAVRALLTASAGRSVNIRSFDPDQPKSNEFVYGLKTTTDAKATVERLAANGLYTIVNETIDVDDGGVSGVVCGDLIEFAPGDTPRCVEKPGTTAISRRTGITLLTTVYGFSPSLDYEADTRVEFSLHPLRRGFRNEHTVIWELEQVAEPPLGSRISWPTRFSRFLGDKAFGLLVADSLGLPVPHTLTISRAVAPFSFGQHTGTVEPWIRTCPVEPVPGRFTTKRGWLDPFALMRDEDPAGTQIASVLAQEGVDAKYSGAALTQQDGNRLIEGVVGWGDEFMVGSRRPARLPSEVRSAIERLFDRAVGELGPISFEWVFDGAKAWIVQIHSGGSASSGRTVYPGRPNTEHRFDVSDGLERLRELVSLVEGTGDGIVLVGDVGVTSHFGDILRKACIPSRVERKPSRTVNQIGH
jgi:hypothetical protein